MRWLSAVFVLTFYYSLLLCDGLNNGSHLEQPAKSNDHPDENVERQTKYLLSSATPNSTTIIDFRNVSIGNYYNNLTTGLSNNSSSSSSSSNNNGVLLLSPSEYERIRLFCEHTACVRKCCPEGKSLKSIEEWTCVPSSSQQSERFWQQLKRIELYENSLSGDDEEPLHIIGVNETLFDQVKRHRLYGEPCEHLYNMNPHEDTSDRIYWSRNGSRLYNEKIGEKQVNQHCLELMDDKNYIVPWICYSEADTGPSTKPVNALYPISIAISIPFLLITFFVYGYVDELRNLHGKSLMCHVAILTVGYLFLILIQLNKFYETNYNFCIICAVTVQFSLLACFFWLNIMCFDLWWTFSGHRSVTDFNNQNRKFILYSIYAWGCPTIITSFTLLVEFWQPMPDLFVRPMFGDRSCWFDDRKATMYYFYGPIGLLLICNMLMFIGTTTTIIRHKRNHSKVLKRSGSRKHCSESEQRRLSVCFKLFVVMGVNWTMEIVSWLVEGPEYLWYFTDIGNALQGMMIFVLFVCKRRVLRLLKRKLFYDAELENLRRARIHSSRSTSITSTGSSKFISRNSVKVKMSDIPECVEINQEKK